MSLIKLANMCKKKRVPKVHKLMTKTAAIPWLSLATAAPGFTAAKSGNPVKWFLANEKVGPIRSLIAQPVALSTFSNSVNRLRNGYTTDSTRIGSAFADSMMGQLMNYGLGTTEHAMKGKVARKILNDVITNEGKYDVPKLEQYLKLSKNIANVNSKLEPHNFGLYGAVGGAGLGIATKDDNEGAIWSGLKGGAKGGLAGLGVNKTVSWIKEGPIGMGSQIHDIYFKNDYWKQQVERANRGGWRKAGQLGSKIFTALPEDRARRIGKFETKNNILFKKLSDLKKTDFKDFFMGAKGGSQS